MTTLASAPIIAALVIFAFGLGIRAPAFLGADRRRRMRRHSMPSDLDAVMREQQSGRVDIAHIGGGDYAARSAEIMAAGAGKRALDVASSIALLIFFAPLLALTAIAIKIDSRGPVLYRQCRIGYSGRDFFIYKFRSMVTDAEKDGAQWASKNDSRITRVGRIIRRTRIDEIPQAINVLLGEMSFVGPRPERPEFVKVLEAEIPNYHLRHGVKPGITGWAQVKFTYGASVEDARVKLQYDLYYIKHYSFWRDVFIILLTMRVALLGLGSR